MATTPSSPAPTHGHAHGHGQPYPYGGQRRHDPLRRMRGLDVTAALRASPRASTAAAAGLLLPLGAALLAAAGLALAATLAAGAALVAPLLVVSSPVLVPFALAAVLTATALLASGALAVAGVSALAWAIGHVWQWWRGEGGGAVTGMVAQPLPLDDDGLKQRHGGAEGAAAFVGHRRLPQPQPRDVVVAGA